MARKVKHRGLLARKDLGALAKSVRLSLEPDRRRIEQRIAAGLQLPRPPEQCKQSLWGISMVKNEEENVEGVVEHLFNQGVDGILIADNGSTDGTPEILHRMSKQYPLFIAKDREAGYFQAQKMDRLAAWARGAGAGWIVPFDADEYWFGASGSLREALQATKAEVARARIFNAFPMDVAGRNNTVWEVDLTPAHLEKVAFRPHRMAKLVHGNHAVIRPGRSELCLRIAHFPWRSFDHFREKVRSRAPAYVATGELGHGSEAAFGAGQVKTQAGSHWRYLASLNDDELAKEWQVVISGSGQAKATWYRRGSTIAADPRLWNTWKLDG